MKPARIIILSESLRGHLRRLGDKIGVGRIRPLKRGITTWVVRLGSLGLAYRWNMPLREALHTFRIMLGRPCAVACGPLIIEW